MVKGSPSSSKLNHTDNVWKRMFIPNSSWEEKVMCIYFFLVSNHHFNDFQILILR